MPKAVLVGLDAFDADLARAWAREGALPTLARLLDEGAAAPTKNPVGLYIGAVWPTLFTGTSPARHGRTCYAQWVLARCVAQNGRTNDAIVAMRTVLANLTEAHPAHPLVARVREGLATLLEQTGDSAGAAQLRK